MCGREEIYRFELHANRDTVCCSVVEQSFIIAVDCTSTLWERNVISILLLQTQRFDGLMVLRYLQNFLANYQPRNFLKIFEALGFIFTHSCQQRRKLCGQFQLDQRKSTGRDGFLVRQFLL